MTISNIPLKPNLPDVTKFHIESPCAEGTKLCSNSPDNMTSVAAMLVHG